MPYLRKYRKKRKKYPRRKMRYRRRRRRPYMSRINYLKLRKQTGFPDQLYAKLKYTDTIDYRSGALSVVDHNFALNGLFDPDLSGVGHQPMGYDVYSQLYGKYQVLASSIKCTLIQGDNNNIRHELIVFPSNTSTPPATIQGAKEQPFTKSRYMSNAANNWLGSIKHFITVKKLEARSTDSINFTGISGNIGFGGNPSSTRYWHIKIHTMNITDIVNCYLEVQIVYYTKWFERRNLSLS